MSEVHVASCVVYTRPEAIGGVARAIRATGIVDLARYRERGREVLRIAEATTGEVMDVIDAVRTCDGVIAVHLAYESDESMQVVPEPQ